MKQILILIGLLACATPASATWNAAQAGDRQQLADGRVSVVVVFTGDKGEGTKIQLLVTNDADLKSQCRAAIVRLNGGADAFTKYPPGTMIDLSESVAAPTADDLAVAAFQAVAQAWQAALAKQAVGRADQAAVDAALAAVQGAYDKAPAGALLRFDQTLIAVVRPPR